MTGMTEEKAVTLAVDVAAVGRAISFAKQSAAANAVKTSIEHKIIVVLDDVLTNIVSYGFDDPTGHEINIEFDLKRRRLAVIVTDDGRAFDPLSQPAPDMTGGVENVAIGGLGLELIRHLADDVSYRRGADRNVLTFTFSLDSADLSE